MAGEVDTPMQQPQPPRRPLGAAAMEAAKAMMLNREGTASQQLPPGGPFAKFAQPVPQPAPQPTPGPQAPDPLSRPYRLPSRGLYAQGEAPGWDGVILIAPTRGQQEELLAGTADQPEAKLDVLRELMRQCIRWGPLPMERMTIPDWTAASLHFLAMCAGSDELNLRPVHQVVGCGKPTPIQLRLMELPCIELELGEAAAAAPEDEDPDIAILRQMQAEERAREGGSDVRVVTSSQVAEPQVASVDGVPVFWRHLRLADLLQAEEFVRRTAEAGRPAGDPMKKGSPFHNYLLARHIIGIGEKQTMVTEALTWVRGQPSPVLDQLRDAIEAQSYGYQTTPRFQCGHCPGQFRMRLPLNGGLFRSRRARAADAGGRAIGA